MQFFFGTIQLLYVMLSAVWQIPAPLSMLMLYKYLVKLVKIGSVAFFVDTDRIHVETRDTASPHSLGTTEQHSYVMSESLPRTFSVPVHSYLSYYLFLSFSVHWKLFPVSNVSIAVNPSFPRCLFHLFEQLCLAQLTTL